MNIYLICTGNTCRSPMAEAIFRSKNLENATIRSAGIHAADGFPIAPNALALIEEAGMPYTATSKPVRQEDVEWADYIFTMTENHKQALLYSYPEAHTKIFTLKEFIDSSSNLDILDPFGGNLAIYRQTFEELTDVIDEVGRKLTGG